MTRVTALLFHRRLSNCSANTCGSGPGRTRHRIRVAMDRITLFWRAASRRRMEHNKEQSVLMIPKRVHTGCMGHHIITSSELLKKKRDDLRTKRDALFKTYSQPPHDFDLARQIKKIDDEV